MDPAKEINDEPANTPSPLDDVLMDTVPLSVRLLAQIVVRLIRSVQVNLGVVGCDPHITDMRLNDIAGICAQSIVGYSIQSNLEDLSEKSEEECRDLILINSNKDSLRLRHILSHKNYSLNPGCIARFMKVLNEAIEEITNTLTSELYHELYKQTEEEEQAVSENNGGSTGVDGEQEKQMGQAGS